jgi:RecB family exonuclease
MAPALEAAAERDRRALARFDQLLDDMKGAWSVLTPAPKLRLATWIDRILLLISEETIAPMEEETRGLLVTSLADLRHVDASVVFIGALTEENLPRRPRRQLFYPDTHDPERDFLRTVDPRTEDVGALMREIALRKTVHLSWPERVGEVEQLPSIVVERLCDVIAVEPLPATPTEKTKPTARTIVGARALAAEIAQAPSEHTGFLTGSAFATTDGTRYAPGGGHVHAITKLESYGRCGFQYFAGQVLGLGEPEDLEEEISPRTRGKLLHAILHEFLSEGTMPADPASLDAKGRERLAAELLRIAEKHLTELPSGDLVSEAVRATFTAGLDPLAGPPRRTGVLAAFLDAEIARRAEHWTPVALEWSFGGRSGEVALATAQGPIRLKGKIDRVDEHVDGGLLVLDYKSGTLPAKIDAESGVVLQLEAYLHAYATAARSSATRWNAAYMSLKPGKIDPAHPVFGPRGISANERHAAAEKFGERLARLTQAMAAGSFPLTVLPEGKAPCRYCPYEGLCRVDKTRTPARLRLLAACDRPVYLPNDPRSAEGENASPGDEAPRGSRS